MIPTVLVSTRCRSGLINRDNQLAALRNALQGYEDSSSDLVLNLGMTQRSQDDPVAAAVLVPVIARGSELHVILTVRSKNLPRHAGQISFPGGRIERADPSPRDAALREAHEEIGLRPEQVEIIGRCPCLRTGTGFLIHPFVGVVAADFRPGLQPVEVESIFEAPLAHLTNLKNYRTESAVLHGSERRYRVILYQSHCIWGATASILHGIAKRVHE